jgi:3-hydroxyisobutyrate dehydrogenase-like beta-hydroxyacid dehydrogenase
MIKVSFLGLGTMGFPMAGHLSARGFSVTVYNRTSSKSASWTQTYKGQMALSASEAVRNSDIVFACLGNDQDVRSLTLGNQGAFSTMRKGALFVDHTTTSAELARELAHKAQGMGLDYLDAPVSGGQVGAEKGQLSIMCGGTEQAFATAEPVMAAYAKICRLMGPSGSGQLTKMVNQIAIAGLLQGLSEALHFSEQAGLKGEKVLDVISQGAARSWQMENRGQTMLNRQFDFGFAVNWMVKDLGICLDEANRNGASLPVTKQVKAFYQELQQQDAGLLDTSSLIMRLGRC